MLNLVLLLLVVLLALSFLVSFGPLRHSALGNLLRSPQMRLLLSGLGIVAAVGLIVSGMATQRWVDVILGIIALLAFGRDALAALRADTP